MSADCLNTIRWWVDASYGVHWDSKGHTGAMMSMGKGAIVNVSKKQKLNTGSSTKAELVGITDVLGMMMWCQYFTEAQGYTIDNNVLYPYNKATLAAIRKNLFLMCLLFFPALILPFFASNMVDLLS